MLDEELRGRLAEWVRPVAALPVPDIQVLRRRARRRAARRAAAAAAVTATAAAAAVGITVSLPGPARPAASAESPAVAGTWYPGRWFPAGTLPASGASPAAAPYVVTIAQGREVVTDVLTGRTAGTVSAPSGSGFAGAAAAGDDRTFVLAARSAAAVDFYEQRLGPDGRPSSPTLVFGLPAGAVPQFAISPDARLLAYTTPGGMRVLSLATGAGRSWTADNGHAISLSWAGDATLAFEWLPGDSLAHAQVRLLEVAAAGTRLLASRQLVAPCANPYGLVCLPLNPLITPDGSKVFATYLFNGKGGLVAQVDEFSALTGRLLAAVTPEVGSNRAGASCGVLWTDPGGEELAAFCGRTGTIVGGRFSPIRLDLPAGLLPELGETIAW